MFTVCCAPCWRVPFPWGETPISLESVTHLSAEHTVAAQGTLVEVGRGRMTIEEFCQVIEQQNRCSAGESVPGHALFLVDVSYEDNELSVNRPK